MEYLQKFYPYSIKQFDEFHRQAFPNASKSTYNSFTQSLKRIEKIYDQSLPELNLSFLKDPHELYNKFLESDYTENTIIATYTHVLKLLKLMDFPLHSYNKFLEILNYNAQKRQLKQERALKEKLEFLPDFQSLRNVIKSRIREIDFNLQFSEIKHLVLISILILSIPMKISSYTGMRFSWFGPEKSKGSWLVNDDNDNWEFQYAGQIIKIVDEDLKKLLDIWKNAYNHTKFVLISNEDSKKPMTSKEIRNSISIATEDIFDIELNILDLRNAYMKHLIELDPDLDQKIQISKILGYVNTDRLDLHKII
tara:strand:+ start:5391 stop:6317 length:927 start_codon:yes stop_codon:yes gene_type:complete